MPKYVNAINRKKIQLGEPGLPSPLWMSPRSSVVEPAPTFTTMPFLPCHYHISPPADPCHHMHLRHKGKGATITAGRGRSPCTTSGSTRVATDPPEKRRPVPPSWISLLQKSFLLARCFFFTGGSQFHDASTKNRVGPAREPPV